MAKYDDSRSRNQIGFAQQRGNELNTGVREGVITPQLDAFRNYYQDAANRGIGERQNIIGNYAPIQAGYQNFANTGGFSPTDISNLRGRALAPTNAVYGAALRGVNQQRTLQGGYSPGYGTLMARMARDKSQQLSDANLGVEASLADMIRQGKLQGLQGLESVNRGLSGLYGTAPGEAGLFGNQLLAGTNQLLESTQQSNQLNQAAAQQQIAASQLPGKYQSALGNIGSTLGTIGQVASIAYPWLRPGGTFGSSGGGSTWGGIPIGGIGGGPGEGSMGGGYNRPNPSDVFNGGIVGL